MKKNTILYIVLTVLAVLALTSIAADDSGRKFTTTLTGAAEVPGPGDPDGSGTATITLNYGQSTVCWEITVSNIALPATGAHIHEGPVGVAGPIDVALSPPDASGSSSGCASVDREEIKEIIQHPEEYYVNVHTTEYPGGAIRGQLSK
jgi:hypothetical protein